jgi:cobalt/nickel transport system permease protein
MHTPDGFITGWICVVILLLSAGLVGYSLLTLRRALDRAKLLRMASLGLVIFAAQMLNFPIASGMSSHLIGAALAAIMLGPHAAVVVIAAVLLLQALAFGDGGMLALGANVFSMAIIGSWSAHLIYRRFERTVGIILASWGSVFAASVSASVLLALSGVAPLFDVILAMVSVHAVIGIGEALISSGIFLYLTRDISRLPSYSLAAGLALLVLLPFASALPDGMESVALQLGFSDSALVLYEAPMAGYLLLGSGLAAGFVGMIAAFSGIYGLGKALKTVPALRV